MPQFTINDPAKGTLGDFQLPDRSSITINDKTWIENPEEPSPDNPFGVPLNTAWYLTEPWRDPVRGVVQTHQYRPILANYPVTITLFAQNIHGNGSINGPLTLVDITNDTQFTLITEDESFSTGKEGEVLLDRTVTFTQPDQDTQPPDTCTVNVPGLGSITCLQAMGLLLTATASGIILTNFNQD